MKRTCAGLTFVCALTYSFAALAQERVSHTGAGIHLTPPAGWQQATLAQVQANRERVRVSDPEFQHALATRSAMPLMVFMKYPEPHDGLNPAIHITARAGLPGRPTMLLAAALEPLRRAFPDFRVVSPPQQTAVGGWPAAYAITSYTLTTGGGAAFPVRSRMWLVPRGNLMFLIGMSGGAAGEDLCENEFADALGSIQIDR